jgi:hypothetical protein
MGTIKINSGQASPALPPREILIMDYLGFLRTSDCATATVKAGKRSEKAIAKQSDARDYISKLPPGTLFHHRPRL